MTIELIIEVTGEVIYKVTNGVINAVGNDVTNEINKEVTRPVKCGEQTTAPPKKQHWQKLSLKMHVKYFEMCQLDLSKE